jgi:16S rRNA (guanine966-N2)-methyltransferase
MRIIAGAWRGRKLSAPPGDLTRPTGERMRQAIFDMLMHAPWGGRSLLEGASVLDGFAGTGALGLEALSRGASTATFIEKDPRALQFLHANIAACDASDHARVIRGDVLKPPKGTPQTLVFLDPPYDRGLLPTALSALRSAGWITPGSVIVAERGRLESEIDLGVKLAHKVHGAAQVNVWREC